MMPEGFKKLRATSFKCILQDCFYMLGLANQPEWKIAEFSVHMSETQECFQECVTNTDKY